MAPRKPKPPTTTPKPDMVRHPPHYTHGGIEAIDVIEAWKLGFCEASALKYICRAGHKLDAVEDLSKAIWFLERAIKQRSR